MILILSFIIVFVLLSICYWTIKNGISPMPTSYKVTKALLTSLPEHVERKIVELGSGWGNLANALAKKYRDCEVIGYETSPIPYYVSRLIYRQKNLIFKRKDFFSEPLHDASLAVCYLYPGAMQQLKTKLEMEGSSQLLIATHTFSIPGWKATKTVTVDDLYRTKIYFYLTSPEKQFS